MVSGSCVPSPGFSPQGGRPFAMQTTTEITDNSALLTIGDASIALVRCPYRTSDNRDRFAYTITLPDGSAHSGDDLRSGCGGSDLFDAAGSLLAFLSACGDSYCYEMRTGRKSDNCDLFPENVAEWAYSNSDEIDMLRDEIEGA